VSEFNPWEHGAPESERASMWSDKSGPGLVAPGATPRTVRHVQQQMALVRMFSNFIRWMHRGA
jgi:hypothetical protein